MDRQIAERGDRARLRASGDEIDTFPSRTRVAPAAGPELARLAQGRRLAGLRRRKGLAEDLELVLMHGIDEHEPGDLVTMPLREQPHQQAAEGMADQHVRRRQLGTVQQRMQVGDELGRAARRDGRIARAAPCAVVAADARVRGKRALHRGPLCALGAEAGLENDHGRAVAAGVRTRRRVPRLIERVSSAATAASSCATSVRSSSSRGQASARDQRRDVAGADRAQPGEVVVALLDGLGQLHVATGDRCRVMRHLVAGIASAPLEQGLQRGENAADSFNVLGHGSVPVRDRQRSPRPRRIHRPARGCARARARHGTATHGTRASLRSRPPSETSMFRSDRAIARSRGVAAKCSGASRSITNSRAPGRSAIAWRQRRRILTQCASSQSCNTLLSR